MIILESTLTTFEASFIFWGSWGSIKNWLELKIEPPLATIGRFSFAKSLKHTVDVISFLVCLTSMNVVFDYILSWISYSKICRRNRKVSISVVHPCRHSPHVATGRLNVSTGSFLEALFLLDGSSKLHLSQLWQQQRVFRHKRGKWNILVNGHRWFN